MTMRDQHNKEQPVRNLFTSYIEPDSEDRKFITALARGMDVIRAFHSRPGPLSNAEISTITRLPKATITRLTHTLSQLGYLAQESHSRKYQLGAALLALAYPVLSSQKIRQLTHDRLADLAQQSQCNVALAMANSDNANMVYLDSFRGSSVNTLRTDIGMSIDIAHSAMGRAYLAGLTSDHRETILATLAKTYPSEWPQLKLRIQAGISQVQEQGFCTVDGEWMSGTRGAAVPIITDTQGTVMAISIGAPSFAISLQRLEQELGPQLLHVTQNIESLINI